MAGITLFGGVALLLVAAPFERTEPLLRLPQQSVTTVEAALLCAFTAWACVIAGSRRLPHWRTPLTLPWLLLVLVMVVASAASPVSRANAFHMTGRLATALGVFLLTVNGLATRARLKAALTIALAVGVVVGALAILEYLGVRPVLAWLTAFRPWVATVGAQVRAGGPLQYPTIASMYLEVVFAFGLGLLLTEYDTSTTSVSEKRDHAPLGVRSASLRRTPSRAVRVVMLFVALVVIGEAITLTFTRAGLITMAASLALVGGIRYAQRGFDAGTRLLAGVAVSIGGLFLASHSTQSMWLRFTSEGQESWYRATVAAPREIRIATGRTAMVPVTVTNTGRLSWDSNATPPILLSYHWLPAEGDGFVSFEGARTPFASPITPDTTVTVDVRVRAPARAGRYRLEWDLVQEGRLWFSTEPGAARTISRAIVSGDLPEAGAEPPAWLPPPRPTVRPGRMVLWRAAVRMIAAHPLLGVGPDNFRLSYGAYAGLDAADTRTHSNNMYLEMLAGGGLLVGAAFGWLLWRAAGSVARAARIAAERDRSIALGIAAAGLAIALHAAVDSFLGFTPTSVLFATTLGCAIACGRVAELRLEESGDRAVPRPAEVERCAVEEARAHRV